jgi:hypothetical protein
MRRRFLSAAIVLLLSCASAFAQQTTGNVTGRVLDPQGAAVPGVSITAKSAATGFTRTEVSDPEGLYRLPSLPVGIYDITAELQGFTTVVNKGIEVNVAQTVTLDFQMKVAALAETVNVTGSTPLIQTTASGVGSVVDVKRIENLPLNGRQFANLAATVPGVGLSFHSDPTRARSTRRWSTAVPAATSTIRLMAATTTTTRSAACCSSSRSKRSRNSTSRRSASRPSTAAATAASSASSPSRARTTGRAARSSTSATSR